MTLRVPGIARLAPLLLLALAAAARAADHFLTMGGGASASNNQVSLEKNIVYFQRCLNDAGLGAAPHDIFFSCGSAGLRDIQFVDPSFKAPRVNQLLAMVFNKQEGFDEQYRRHNLSNVRGPSNHKAITEWFDQVGAKLPEGDRLFIYFTGHGGRGNPARNTTMTMWAENAMTVKEFQGLLDKVPPKVEVVIIMVQCHSGGFGDVIFKTGSDNKELAAHNRCGFYATVPERMAAGCTSDIAEENYREYSTYFWAGLYGKSRAGDAVPPPDFDADGQISFCEAHAYVQLHSDTIDIPISTSDVFLRQFSKTKADGHTDLLTADTPFTQLIKHATPVQRAVLLGLCETLKLGGEGRIKSSRDAARQIEKDRQKLDADRNKLNGEYAQIRGELQTTLKLNWPEIANAWHPRVRTLLQDEAPAVIQAIESHAKFKRFDELAGKMEELSEKSETLERTWVKHQRIQRLAETIALAANLPRFTSAEQCERYEKLQQAEAGTMPVLKSGPSTR